MIKYHPHSTTEHALAQIFTIQGHPEFTPAMVSRMVDARSASGVFDALATTEARRRLGGKDGSGGEGLGRIGWAVWRVLLQELPLQYSSNRNGDGNVDMNGTINGEHTAEASQTSRFLEDNGRYAHVDKVLDRQGPWTNEEFQGGKTVKLGSLNSKSQLIIRRRKISYAKRQRYW